MKDTKTDIRVKLTGRGGPVSKRVMPPATVKDYFHREEDARKLLQAVRLPWWKRIFK